MQPFVLGYLCGGLMVWVIYRCRGEETVRQRKPTDLPSCGHSMPESDCPVCCRFDWYRFWAAVLEERDE